MAAKWQQWMPLHIDRFKGSPSVQAMHPIARIGYLYLLLCCWQSDDCTIPSDDLTLADLSGLGDDLWQVYRERILRKFERNRDNSLVNSVLLSEWNDAKRIFESRKAAANRTNTVRYKDGHRTVTDGGPSRSADTITLTLTSTDTNTKTNTTARSVPPEELAGTLPLVDGTFHRISVVDIGAWELAFPAVDIRQALNAMRVWFEANPGKKKTKRGINRFIVNWLDRSQNHGGNGKGRQASPVNSQGFKSSDPSPEYIAEVQAYFQTKGEVN